MGIVPDYSISKELKNVLANTSVELEATAYFFQIRCFSSSILLPIQIPMASFSNHPGFHKQNSEFPWSHAQSMALKATSKWGKSAIS